VEIYVIAFAKCIVFRKKSQQMSGVKIKILTWLTVAVHHILCN